MTIEEFEELLAYSFEDVNKLDVHQLRRYLHLLKLRYQDIHALLSQLVKSDIMFE